MAFVQAMTMNTTEETKKGVNGADVYTEKGVGDYRVSLFATLVRGQTYTYLNDHIQKVFAEMGAEAQKDLFVMAFQTRDVRGGKGEKKLFYNFFLSLLRHDREVAVALLPLVPEYGCWRDVWEILNMIPELEQEIFAVVLGVWNKDTEHFKSGEAPKMSLLAKWLPREGSGTYPGMAQKVAKALYPKETSDRKRMIQYRKAVSAMNKALKTVEINMCGRSWAEIRPEAVPGRCLKTNRRAFLNQNRDATEPILRDDLRFPDSEDRNTCRQHFLEFIDAVKEGKKKAHGADVIMPHELVSQVKDYHVSQSEGDLIQAQWNSIREKTLELGGLGKCVPMCDFSGSMKGLPKVISLALGILISEVNHASFKDHILTFDAEPKWHSFAGLTTMEEKVDSIGDRLGQGLNTNFYKACMSILAKMKEHRVPVGEEPEDLIVLTDMGFDDACREHKDYGMTLVNDMPSVEDSPEWEGQLTMIREAFQKVGEEVWGEGQGWKPPRIVIWNLRAAFNDFHAKADQDGVLQLSGWSPSMLKALQAKGVQVRTPYEGMRQILDNERYDPIRAVWEKVHGTNEVAGAKAA
jgi:hypothetical protein